MKNRARRVSASVWKWAVIAIHSWQSLSIRRSITGSARRFQRQRFKSRGVQKQQNPLSMRLFVFSTAAQEQCRFCPDGTRDFCSLPVKVTGHPIRQQRTRQFLTSKTRRTYYYFIS